MGSADTEAREPQRRIHKLAEYDVPKLVAEVRAGIPAYEVCEPRQCYAPTLNILADLLAEAYAALAAGVGVPPDESSLGSAAENAARCLCGHTRHWHSNGGEGDCEASGDCACGFFALEGLSGQARVAAADIRESFSEDEQQTRWLFELADLLDALAGVADPVEDHL